MCIDTFILWCVCVMQVCNVCVHLEDQMGAVKLNTMHDVTMFVSVSVCTIIRQVYFLPHA